MCIIAIKTKDTKMFDEKTLKTMFENNPDGAGYMYVDNGQVIIKKGFMTYKDLKKSLDGHDFTNKNLVVHFRIGTSGLNDKLNCHPYPIDKMNGVNVKCNLGMAHNGILYDYTPRVPSKKNDTQYFIEYVLTALKNDFISDSSCRYLISELIGPNNKLAFLDSNDNITMINHFIKDNGYYFSNTSYKQPRYKKQTSVHDNIKKVNELDEMWDWWKH